MTDNKFDRILNEKGSICISLILPTHRLSPERRTDQLQLDKLVERVKMQVHERYSKEQYASISSALASLISRIDFNHNREGLGIFLSPSVQQIVQFDFPVKEKEQVADSFAIREVLYLSYLSRDYYLLEINEKTARLFKGLRNTLEEVTDSVFPQAHEESYEYSRPTRGSSFMGDSNLKGFERDKSVMEEVRMRDFLREVDELLESYLHGEPLLLIAGVEKELAYFREITRYQDKLAAAVPGNYTYSSVSDLAALVWPELRSYLEKKKLDKIKEYEKKIGSGQGVSGLQDIWMAANEGRAATLLVEQDFSQLAFASPDKYILYLSEPEEPHVSITDAVDELIHTVLDKNGEVIIMENGTLEKYGRAALITRY